MDEARVRELLAAERARIEPQFAALVQPDDQQLADEATELYEDEVRVRRTEDLREQLHAVERAEERLAAGTYGLSVESGLPIPDERLEVEPTAERTVEEEAQLEGGPAPE